MIITNEKKLRRRMPIAPNIDSQVIRRKRPDGYVELVLTPLPEVQLGAEMPILGP